ncbi:MAG: glycosyltransferase [Muribaculaceae bacterium]|nr:glycosyltransferase [Muribaculaceae bacterium]
MADPEVSIIVPVYNMEKYLEQCLDSIVSQTFTNWECIIVDDGSKDRSGEMCDGYAKRDNRFKVLHVKNGGLSYARNIGLKEAMGKYIAFCDSDDWMEPEMVEFMYRLITSTSADIVQTGIWKEFTNHRKLRAFVKARKSFNREEAMVELAKDKNIPSYVWNKMFRKDIIGMDFPEGKAFEDLYVCSKWFPKINKLVCDPTPLYHYRMRKGSIVHSGKPEYLLDALKAHRFRADEFLKQQIPSFNQKAHDLMLTEKSVYIAKNIARHGADKKSRLYAVKQIANSLTLPDKACRKSLSKKLRFRSQLLKNHPDLFTGMMRFLGKLDLYKRFVTRNLFD